MKGPTQSKLPACFVGRDFIPSHYEEGLTPPSQKVGGLLLQGYRTRRPFLAIEKKPARRSIKEGARTARRCAVLRVLKRLPGRLIESSRPMPILGSRVRRVTTKITPRRSSTWRVASP